MLIIMRYVPATIVSLVHAVPVFRENALEASVLRETSPGTPQFGNPLPPRKKGGLSGLKQAESEDRH